MIFRQFVDADSSTYTYLLGDPWSREAVLVDPVRENLGRDLKFLEELGLTLTYSIETHVHADHVTAGSLLRARTRCKLVTPKAGQVEGTDIEVEDGDAITFGLQALEVRATPGHTAGCVSYVTADQSRVFTGDALLVRGCGRTDFQEGDARLLYRSVRDKLFSLPRQTLVCPAHDYKGRTVSSIGEERLYNPRLGGGRTEEQFVEIMQNLSLAYPRKIDVAVPANRRAGLLEEEQAPAPDGHHVDPGDFPVYRTPTGAPNVPGIWVAEHLDAVELVDIREAEEWDGPDGRIAGATWIPMGQLASEAASWDREAPVVLMCRSGGRSDRAAKELEAMGFKSVASLSGGILKWARMGLPFEDGAQG